MDKFKELSVEEIEKLDTAAQITYFNDLNAHKAEQLKAFGEQLKTDTSKELKDQIATLKAEINESNVKQLESLTKAMDTQGLALTQLLAKGVDNKVSTLDSILKAKAAELKELAGNQSQSLKITVDKTTVLTTAVVDSTLAYHDPALGRIARARNVIRQLFSSVPVGLGNGGTVRWVEYTLDTNNAAFQTEGNLKAEGAMAWIEKSAPIQLVAEWIKVSRQMLDDFSYVAGEIRTKLMRDLEAKVDGSLFSGSGTPPEITGIYTYADTYTPVASGITDASIYDLIPVVSTAISATTDYMPNYVLMNATDILGMKLKKDANNNYVMPPFANLAGMMVDNMIIVESSKVTANTMLVGDFDFATLYSMGSVDITLGYENQDFTKNLVTILAEERLALVVKGTDTGAFNKVTDIAAALVTLAS